MSRSANVQPMALEDIRNFVTVSDNLATAGQPTEQQLEEVARAGFEVVVNLGLLDPRYCLPDEAALAGSLGMVYHHIPVDFQAPAFEDLRKFFDLMDVSRNKNVFVHCAANYRVSTFVALYGQARLGWSLDQAEAHIRRIWDPNETWKTFIEVSRQTLASAEAPVHVVPYDPSWPARFEEEEKGLRRALAAWLVGSIEHIGSTAIPGLAAKPVIDIMAGVETLEASRPAIAVLADLGYCYAPYRAESEHWFCKPSPAFRTHHLHLMPFDSPRWIEAIAFRDYLRSHSQIATEYEELKRRLAQEYRLDREAYTEAKGPFIARITGLALHAR